MNSKARVRAALAGQPVDRVPVTALYSMLYQQDHFAELTGRPAWEVHRWLAAEPDTHLALYRVMQEQAPFELLQPQGTPTREARERTEFLLRDGMPCRRDRKTGACTPLATGSDHPFEYLANETRHIFDRRDADEQIQVVPAEAIRASGTWDYAEALVGSYGREHYILTGGVIGTIYGCGAFVGQTNLLAMLIEEPELVEYLCAKLLEKNIEEIRAIAACGGDAIYIDDATATSDMISVAHYERFSLPYMQAMVGEIHRLGHQVIVIYFGGVMDRLEQIAATGADGFAMETSMKGFTNDIGAIADRIGDRITLFGNIDPIGVLQDGTDNALSAEIARQHAACRRARGFITCTGSPITPFTPLARVQRFIETGKRPTS